jgi:AraC family transcriptional regulator, positive regulator of tynA and feaB
MLRVYDTSTQHAREQFDYWREELCHNFVEMAPERKQKGLFSGRISQRSLDAISVSQVSADGHCVNRTPIEIAHSSEECFFANLQLAGTGRTRQGGHEIISGPGDLVLVDASAPYSIAHDDAFDLISVKVPHALLVNRLEFKRCSRTGYVAAARGYGVILRSYTLAILNELDTQFIESAPFLAENLTSLIASALNASHLNNGLGQLGSQRYSQLQAIRGYIKLNMSDPSLDLPSVCRHFGLSERAVQKLFARTGSTFSRTLLECRLDRVAHQLRSRENARSTVTEVALAWGFNDSSYFSRAFKAKFGITAREHRARAVTEGSLPPRVKTTDG